MTLEDALHAAIDYEIRIRDLYREAAGAVSDESGRRMLEMLAGDEENHVAYLEHCLRSWKETGHLTTEGLAPVIPSPDRIERHVRGLRPAITKKSLGDDKQLLSRALALEIETSAFYEKMAAEMTGPGRDLFGRFLEIENGHIAAVQAELDYMSQTGYWFDFQEFDME
jgi:rubrerythrin